MSLGMNLENSREEASARRQEEAAQQLGDSTELGLRLPDGTEKTLQCRMGHSVAYVKALLQEEFGFPVAKQKLLFSGRPLLDPLSLSDCPGLQPQKLNMVEVQLDQ